MTANLKPTGIEAQLHWQCRGSPVAAEALLVLAERHCLREELFNLLFTNALFGGMRIAEADFASSLTVTLPAYCLRNSTPPAFIPASLNAASFTPGNLLLEIRPSRTFSGDADGLGEFGTATLARSSLVTGRHGAG